MIIHVELPSCSLTCSPSFYIVIYHIYIYCFFWGGFGCCFCCGSWSLCLNYNCCRRVWLVEWGAGSSCRLSMRWTHPLSSHAIPSHRQCWAWCRWYRSPLWNLNIAKKNVYSIKISAIVCSKDNSPSPEPSPELCMPPYSSSSSLIGAPPAPEPSWPMSLCMSCICAFVTGD